MVHKFNMKENNKNKKHKKEEKLNNVEFKSTIEEPITTDYEDLYKRALADYQNLKRRCEKEKSLMVKFSNEVLIEKLLGIVGDLEIAADHTGDDGIKSIYNKLVTILSNEGLTVIDPIGLDFDSVEHEAVESVSGKKGKIVKVLQKGYKLNSKVLKPAIVSVGNGE